MNSKPTKIAFHTFGCKLNFAETSTIARSFYDKGYKKVDKSESADLIVINTCSVTKNAEKKCQSLIKQVRKKNPNIQIALVGCYSQLRPDELNGFEGVDYILGNEKKFNLVEHIESNYNNCYISSEDINKSKIFSPSYSLGDRTRSFLKIQDGCDYFCTFCAIPYARGRSRSNTIENLINEAEIIAEQGTKELILTGVNIGTFDGNSGSSLFELLKELEKVKGIERIRISSIEPNLLSDDIIELVAKSKVIMPHFHIPLQSGSDKILAQMKRKYKRQVFANRVFKIKQLIPKACVAADVIIGFPGELEEDFQNTYSFIDELPVSFLHVFTYSDRPEAKASEFIDKVPSKVKKERSKKLHQLGAQKARIFHKYNFEKEHYVLWEGTKNKGFLYGFTENYIQVKSKFNPNLINKINPIILNNIDENGEFLITFDK
ncbi:MAG: tRNA (N(6)-L-threonylcarbamoyladenosine(37)-C(2))-methylthiotransferase MtaB [Bacteroidales bacterium]|jgi:threonylcarbamoyladenosine tRNA methylthiotransferase MtaB|nr:tRNA (N(6)-L-threonylcarbamoyladenosine(37)-C(2))-methylthiotransferase MtaB [Bacteroidales bacterium]